MKDIILISALENAIINWHSKTKNHEFEYNTGKRVAEILNIAHQISNIGQIFYGEVDILENNISYNETNMIMEGNLTIPYKIVYTKK